MNHKVNFTYIGSHNKVRAYIDDENKVIKLEDEESDKFEVYYYNKDNLNIAYFERNDRKYNPILRFSSLFLNNFIPHKEHIIKIINNTNE